MVSSSASTASTAMEDIGEMSSVVMRINDENSGEGNSRHMD